MNSYQSIHYDSLKQFPYRSAQTSGTRNPFVFSHLRSLKLGNPSNEQEVEELASLLDKQANESQTPMEHVQLKLQKHWLKNPNENVAEACLMFACLPGMAGIPTPDGSSDPLMAPVIDNNCLNEYDTRAFLLMLRFIEDVAREEPFRSLLIQEPPQSDEELIRTIPMASRELGGVVDSNLIVYGTKNLRVVDAGIFPTQLSTMPQASVYAVAEKGNPRE
ncbi:hypothetical protein Clacol_007865 [Clathrus columnatus]|uniref:Glucose-methanol-choline oxidoreductase C-terminal domain-containing protein n=1 Tax=Clathrus columnatus TaxID=1419009 RepID=A0AAV5AKF3_9AGAM|nr:hypothetical protein Clacol_007865 [Clathrus columnatus]